MITILNDVGLVWEGQEGLEGGYIREYVLYDLDRSCFRLRGSSICRCCTSDETVRQNPATKDFQDPRMEEAASVSDHYRA